MPSHPTSPTTHTAGTAMCRVAKQGTLIMAGSGAALSRANAALGASQTGLQRLPKNPSYAGAGALNSASHALNYTALTSLFQQKNSGRIWLERDTYDVGAQTLIVTQPNLWIKGQRGGTTLTTSALTLIDHGIPGATGCGNIIWEDINFVSTGTNSASDSYNALVRWAHIFGGNYTFNRCTFNVPNSQVNALKIICGVSGAYSGLISGVYFNECQVIGAGRMGFEIENTDAASTTSRVFDVRWKGGSIKNTGLLDPVNGQGISCTGYMEDMEFDARFANNGYAAVELVGACNTTVRGRCTNLVPVTGTTPSAALSFTANPYLTTASRRMTDNRVIDFVADDGTSGEIRLWCQDRLVTQGCFFNVRRAGTVSGIGAVTYAGTTNSLSVGDRYDCDGLNALQGMTIYNQGGMTAGNEWHGLTINHTASASAASLVTFSGEGTNGNTIRGLSYNPQNPDEIFITNTAAVAFAGSITPGSGGAGTLTVAGVADPSYLATGQTIYQAAVPNGTHISGPGTISGANTTYPLSNLFSSTLPSVSNMTTQAGRALSNFITGPLRNISPYNIAGCQYPPITGVYPVFGDNTQDLAVYDAFAHVVVTGCLNITGTFTASRAFYFPGQFPPLRITNSTNQSITVQQTAKFATAVTIASGATVTIGATSTGPVVIP